MSTAAASLIVAGPGEAFFLCTRRMVVGASDRASRLPLRPDVPEAAVVNLAEQLLLAVGGQVRKEESKAADAGDSDRLYINVEMNEDTPLPAPALHLDLSGRVSAVSQVSCYFGVTSISKHREMVIYFKNSGQGGGSALSLFGSGYASTEAFSKFATAVEERFIQAFEAEKLLIMHTGCLSSTETDLMNLTGAALQSQSNIDANFVRDLQLAYAHEMFVQTSAAAAPLDRDVSQLERQCARLMTVLKPTYSRCEFVMPSPPAKRSVKAYALVLARDPIARPSIELAKLVLFRAKKAAKKLCAQSEGGESNLLKFTLLEIHSQLVEWCEEETSIRVARKAKAVQDRVRDVEAFRDELLWILHTRYTYFRLKPIDRSILQPQAEDVPGRTLSSADKTFMSDLHSKCRLFGDEDPSLLNVSVTFCSITKYNPANNDMDFYYNSLLEGGGGKRGTLYLSSTYLYCESSTGAAVSRSIFSSLWGGLSGSSADASSGAGDSEDATSIDIPLQNVVSISIVDSRNLKRVVVGNLLEPVSLTGSADTSATATDITRETLLIVDNNNTASLFICEAELSDYTHRLADLLLLLIKGDYYHRSQAAIGENSKSEVTMTKSLDSQGPSLLDFGAVNNAANDSGNVVTSSTTTEYEPKNDVVSKEQPSVSASNSDVFDFLESSTQSSKSEDIKPTTIESNHVASNNQVQSQGPQSAVSPSKDFFDFLDEIGSKPTNVTTNSNTVSTSDNDNFLSFLDNISSEAPKIPIEKTGSVSKTADDDFLSSLDSISVSASARPVEPAPVVTDSATQKKASALSKNIKAFLNQSQKK